MTMAKMYVQFFDWQVQVASNLKIKNLKIFPSHGGTQEVLEKIQQKLWTQIMP